MDCVTSQPGLPLPVKHNGKLQDMHHIMGKYDKKI